MENNDKISKNTRLKDGVVESFHSNTTSLNECVQQCCGMPSCNVAYFKAMKDCYLLRCTSDELCKPVLNTQKNENEPADYLIDVRPVGNYRKDLYNLSILRFDKLIDC